VYLTPKNEHLARGAQAPEALPSAQLFGGKDIENRSFQTQETHLSSLPQFSHGEACTTGALVVY
jgi:hypothetical protein